MHKLDEHLTTTAAAGACPSDEKPVVLSNALVRAGQGLSLAEKRLVCLGITKLNRKTPLPPGQQSRQEFLKFFPTSRITADEYAEEFGLDKNTAYEQLQAAGKSLYERSITVFTPAGERKGKPLEPTRENMRWVGKCKYHVGEGWIELSWWHEVLPELINLGAKFTKYQLAQTAALRSIYSWRLLELLTLFEKKGTGWAEFTVEDFAASMDCTEKQRENFNNIKRRIIEPAIAELKNKDNWLITWEPSKKIGKKVTSIRFEFSRNPQGQLSL